ncbi:MAG TPA: hypothetical protein VFU53_10990, partial [Burkholderiales bacterium]|nr:hypothetical protein [Burkholderiales bacterium]
LTGGGGGVEGAQPAAISRTAAAHGFHGSPPGRPDRPAAAVTAFQAVAVLQTLAIFQTPEKKMPDKGGNRAQKRALTRTKSIRTERA